jgi:transcriptional regulator with XRE-family HTH domain
MDTATFSEWLKDQLKQQNMTQVELAKRSYISVQAVSHYICGRSLPTYPVMETVLNALGKKLVIVDKEEEKQ